MNAAPRARGVQVWDAPVRVFHWLTVLSFAGAWLTSEHDGWRAVHATLGYTVAGLVAFRLLWGLVGTRHARFADFVCGPKAVLRYLRSLLQGRPEPHAGHNPAGGWAILALLALAALTTALGWAAYTELGGEWTEDAHEAAANLLLAVVGVHVAGVLVGSWLHRENLVRAMFTGRKEGGPADGIRGTARAVAVLLLAAVAGFWVLQWRHAAPRGQAHAAVHGPALARAAPHGRMGAPSCRKDRTCLLAAASSPWLPPSPPAQRTPSRSARWTPSSS